MLTNGCFALPQIFNVTERVPLAAIYCTIGPEKARLARHISIEALKQREALAEILYGTHTDRVVEPDRVTSPFDAAKRIVEAVPVRCLTLSLGVGIAPGHPKSPSLPTFGGFSRD